MSTTSRQMKKLARYLRALREELGLSMHEVARRSNLTPGHISKIEKGDSFSSISVKTLVAFSEVYNVPPVSILEKADFIKKGAKNGLPSFSPYLKIKYGLSPQQVRDMRIALEIIEKKFKK